MTEDKPKPDENQDEGKLPEIEEKESSRQLTGTFGDTEISYTARAATQVFEIEESKASFFYVSYTQDDADPATRPVLFCFNGGPGSSTVWLHLGLFGPKRMVFDDEGFKLGMQGKLVDNQSSILDVCDVVCVDAIGTGFSRVHPKEKEEEFHHFKRDVEAFSEFIVRYLNRNDRWLSPKYLAGESYGTLRAAAIARKLFVDRGVEFNGVMLISAILNYQTSGIDIGTMMVHPGNDLPFALYLPTYAATARYHGRLAKKYQSMALREFLDEVEAFALSDYWLALAQGDLIDQKTRTKIAGRLSDYTGLDPDYIDHYDLRIHILRFCKELLREEHRTVGRLDSRYTGIDRVRRGENIEADPSSDATTAVASAALNDYLRREIGFQSDDVYEILSLDVNRRWDYEDFKNRYVDTSEQMRELLSRSRGTRVLVANGYYDLATPHFATEYTFSHMGLDPEVRPNVRMEYYEAGHMMYVHLESLDKLAAALRDFVTGSS